MSWIVQCRDLEEGNGALWFTLKNSEFESKDSARKFVSRLIETDHEESLCLYRVVLKDSPESFSQPTDRLEY